MDQSKLHKAFERNKAIRLTPSPEHVETESKHTEALAIASKQVIPDLIPRRPIPSRNASISDMRNPNPMAVTEMKKNKLVYSGMKNRAVLNAFRELRIQLTDKQNSNNLAVMMSSVDSADHSIVTAMNLAISFSLDVNSSALLVDCNPYGTDLQSLVTASFSGGITDYFSDQEMGLENIIYPSGIDRVSVIPAGSQAMSAVEQFSSPAMQDLVYELKNRYSDRFIIINAPPVSSNSEARVLTRYCDHTILTVPYGRVNVDMIEDAVDALGAANVTGVIYQQ